MNDRTLTEAAIMTLVHHGEPMRTRDIWDYIDSNGLWESNGKTPWMTLSAELFRRCKGVKASQGRHDKFFFKAGLGKYGLVEWLNEEEVEIIEQEERVETEIESLYSPDASLLNTNLFLEREWHRWLYKNLEANGLEALGFGKLRLFDDDKQGAATMAKYNTGIVGEIDMLLKNEHDDLIVVELKRKGVDETVGQVCRYVGWVQEHLLMKDKKIYGVIIAQEIDEKIRYAIKPIKDYIFYQQLIMSVEFGESSKEG